jgi:hypothetical protein
MSRARVPPGRNEQGGKVKKRILAVIATAGLGVVLAAVPASAAYTSPWHSTTSAYIQLSCGAIQHGHSSSQAFIKSNGCNWNVGIRAQYNEAGANYTTAWAWNAPSAFVNRDRISLHQFSY